MSVESFSLLLKEAYEHIENDDLVKAMEVAKKILNEDSEHPMGLEIMGYLLLELNCIEEAKFCFSKSIENGNNENHTPYLYLGQLTNGEESVVHFLKAIDMIRIYLSKEDDGKLCMFKPSKLDLSNCFVSLSEIYMTDLCDNEDAEIKCREYITKAIEEDDKNPASWQALASLNLIMNDKENCKINMQKSLSLWLPEAKKIMSDNHNEDDEMNNEIVATCDLSAELRTKCAEILFEVDLFDDMRAVLETVLVEDDEHMQAHYLMALLLEAKVEKEGVTEADKGELKESLVTHADMALNLADAEVEAEAVQRMTALLNRYADEEDDEESGSSCDDSNDSDSENVEME